MTPYTEIGEMVISTPKRDYFLRPSFSSMSRIGSPSEIVEAYAILNGHAISSVIASAVSSYKSVPGWLLKAISKPAYGRSVLSTAMIVMQACCDDDMDELIGTWYAGARGIVYRKGAMPTSDIIVLARELIEHGIIGKAKVRRLQRHETNNYVNEFRAFDYISSARHLFGMPRAEAEQLTMTEFQLMMNAKFPEQKGFTKDEYDETRDNYLAKRAKRIQAEEANRLQSGSAAA